MHYAPGDDPHDWPSVRKMAEPGRELSPRLSQTVVGHIQAMSAKLSCYVACLLAVLAAGCQSTSVAEKKPRPVTDSDLIGNWVGLTEDGIYYFRIDLQRSSKGRCAYAYVHDDARLLAVNNWSTEAGRIQMAVLPIDPDQNSIEQISGTAHASIMELSVTGKGWQRRLVLRREDDMERRAGLVKNRMEQHRKNENAQANSWRRFLNIGQRRVVKGSHIFIFDFAERPPCFRKCEWVRENRTKNLALKSRINGVDFC